MTNMKITSPNVSQVQFEEAMARYARAEKRETQINKLIQSDVNTLIQLYEDELHRLAYIKKVCFETAQAYCKQHKEKLSAGNRHIGTPYGVAGFKLGTPQQNNRWQMAFSLLKEKLPSYVCTTEEPAHNVFLAGRYKESVAPLLIELGTQAMRDDHFYIEPIIAA